MQENLHRYIQSATERKRPTLCQCQQIQELETKGQRQKSSMTKNELGGDMIKTSTSMIANSMIT